MKVKKIAEGSFRIVAVCDGDQCPVQDFIVNGEASTKASREGLVTMLNAVAERGFQKCPSAWFHEASKDDGIYEFIKGNLRIFFFKGSNGDIAVCTAGIVKKGQKADKASVKKAAHLKGKYETAILTNSYEVIDDAEQNTDQV